MSELLVSMMLFGVIGLSISSFIMGALRTAGVESRASIAAMELRNALGALSSELRMSTSSSPYYVGTIASTVNCSSRVVITSTSVKFLVTEDDSSASTSGIRSYYVGYVWDSATKRLMRGEVQAPSTTDCTLPGGDPTSVTYARPIAENVSQVDSDGNGTLDTVFTLSSNKLIVNLGISVSGFGTRKLTQDLSTQIHMRGT